MIKTRVAKLDAELMRPMYVNRMARAMLNGKRPIGTMVWASDEHQKAMVKSCETRLANSEAAIIEIVRRHVKEWEEEDG